MRSRGRSGAKGDNSGKYICSDCGVDAGKMDPDDHSPGVWTGDREVHHCEGTPWVLRSRYRGEPHHYISLHLDCWKCGAPMGCLICAGVGFELLCENVAAHKGLGAVWANKRAFLEHGPIIRQRRGRTQILTDYPPSWAIEYEPLEVKGNPAANFLNELIGTIGKPMPEPSPRDYDQ